MPAAKRKMQILADISFSLSPGEITCLLGPSGCGKTSILRLAAGIVQPSSGRILLDDKEISGPKRYVPPEKRGVGLMFQDYALFPHMTILENVAYGLTALDKTEAQKTANRALQRVGLETYANSFPGQLSGGEQQRVALARAIVPRPQVMLMDEPFSGLDQRLRQSVRAETLALLREARATTMLVTHDPVEAMDVADRIILMRAGRIVQISEPNAAFMQPVDIEAARFFNDYNEFVGTAKAGCVSTPLGTFKAGSLSDGTKVTVMIRPQSIQISNSASAISGAVIGTRFLGDQQRLTIKLTNDGTVISIFAGMDVKLQKQQIVKLKVKTGDVLIFTNPADHTK